MTEIKYFNEKDLQRKIKNKLNNNGFNFKIVPHNFDLIDKIQKIYVEVKLKSFVPAQILYAIARKGIKDSKFIGLACAFEIRFYKSPSFYQILNFAKEIDPNLLKSPSNINKKKWNKKAFQLLGFHYHIYPYKGELNLDKPDTNIFIDKHNNKMMTTFNHKNLLFEIYTNLVLSKDKTGKDIANKFNISAPLISILKKKISQLKHKPIIIKDEIVCYECKEKENLIIHHNHFTGEQIAIVCDECNDKMINSELNSRDNENHKSIISISTSKKQKIDIMKMADDYNLSVSEFILEAIFNRYGNFYENKNHHIVYVNDNRKDNNKNDESWKIKSPKKQTTNLINPNLIYDYKEVVNELDEALAKGGNLKPIDEEEIKKIQDHKEKRMNILKKLRFKVTKT